MSRKTPLRWKRLYIVELPRKYEETIVHIVVLMLLRSREVLAFGGVCHSRKKISLGSKEDMWSPAISNPFFRFDGFFLVFCNYSLTASKDNIIHSDMN